MSKKSTTKKRTKKTQNKIVRRVPGQARSKERVELILATALRLIGERGNDAVSMREIAAEAGIPISSVYQYFPDKSALLMKIMEGFYNEMHETFEKDLKDITNLEELSRAIERNIKYFVNFFQERPALSNIWAGVLADPGLTKLDVQDSYRNAELFTGTVLRCAPGLRKSEVKTASLYFSHTMGAIMRFSLSVSETEGRALVKEAVKLFNLRLNDLVVSAKDKIG